MSLEEEIKQVKFKNDYQKAVVNIIYTYNHTIGALGKLFKSRDLTRQQYNVLRILRGQHPSPTSIGIIKERMLDKMSDASRIVERLRIKGLIVREQNKQDKRATEVVISDKGLALLSELDTPISDFEFNNVALNDKEVQTLNELLDKMRTPK